MKITLLIPSLQSGGMERVMSQLLHCFAGIPKVELHLVLYGMTREVFYPLPGKVKIHKPPFAFSNQYRFWFTIKTLIFLRKKIKEIQPDTLLSFGEIWNNFVLLALYGTSFPVYVSDRCQPDKNLGRFHQTLRRLLYPKAAGVIAQTAIAKSIYEKQFNNQNIQVIGNPIKAIKKDSEKKREKIVLTVGRLIHSKHHDQLIRLFSALDRPEWKLIIVGGDALKQKNKVRLETLIKELGAENRVELTGTRSDVTAFYQKSSIFAFTSSSEGFPNVVGEALSAGLPVVAFDCIAGPAEMIRDGYNGYLVKLFDYKAFSEKLALLMDDEYHREQLALQAPAIVQAFNHEVIGAKFFNFITEKI